MSASDELYELGLRQVDALSNQGYFGDNVAGVGAGMLNNPNFSTVMRKPWLDMPDGSVPYDNQGKNTLPVAPNTVDTLVLQFRVPDGYDGVINAYACNFTGAGFVDFSGDIVWRIFVGGKAVPNFGTILNQRGSTEKPRRVDPIRIYSGQLVQGFVIHPANVALAGDASFTFQGYFYPNTAY